MLLLILLLCQLTMDTPAQVTVGQPFTVRVGGAEKGQLAYLYLVDGQANVRLTGTAQAVVEGQTATFPEVRVQADPDFTAPLRLVAVVLQGNRSESVVSNPVLVQPAADTITLQDVSVGLVGVELQWDDNKLTVEPQDGGAAQRAGVEGGDRLEAVDGRSVHDIEGAASRLRGKPGTPVVLTLRNGTKVREVTVVRSELRQPPLEFEPINYQGTLSPFQVTVHVFDDHGQPLPGAHVSVRLDPAYTKEHVLVFTTDTILSDASGTQTPELTAVTGPDGRATLWVRLYNATTPFDARLQATASYRSHTSHPVTSNLFTVYRR